MTTPLTLSTERRGDGRPVLIAVGEIDMSNVDAFASALREAVGAGDTLTVDLSAVESTWTARPSTPFTCTPITCTWSRTRA